MRWPDAYLTTSYMGIPRCNFHRRCFSAIRPTSAPNAAEPLDALRRRAATSFLWLRSARRCTAELQRAACKALRATTRMCCTAARANSTLKALLHRVYSKDSVDSVKKYKFRRNECKNAKPLLYVLLHQSNVGVLAKVISHPMAMMNLKNICEQVIWFIEKQTNKQKQSLCREQSMVG